MVVILEEAFEKERSIRASLEEKLSSLEETYAICVSKLRKDNELSLGLAKTHENEKVELGIAHERLVDDHEKTRKRVHVSQRNSWQTHQVS